jgi:hypothetical protein
MASLIDLDAVVIRRPATIWAPESRRLIVAKANIWTVPHGEGWANRREGNREVSETFATKAEALHAGRETARLDHVEHVVAHLDGRVGRRRNFGAVSRSPRA